MGSNYKKRNAIVEKINVDYKAIIEYTLAKDCILYLYD